MCPLKRELDCFPALILPLLPCGTRVNFFSIYIFRIFADIFNIFIHFYSNLLGHVNNCLLCSTLAYCCTILYWECRQTDSAWGSDFRTTLAQHSTLFSDLFEWSFWVILSDSKSSSNIIWFALCFHWLGWLFYRD